MPSPGFPSRISHGSSWLMRHIQGVPPLAASLPCPPVGVTFISQVTYLLCNPSLRGSSWQGRGCAVGGGNHNKTPFLASLASLYLLLLITLTNSKLGLLLALCVQYEPVPLAYGWWDWRGRTAEPVGVPSLGVWGLVGMGESWVRVVRGERETETEKERDRDWMNESSPRQGLKRAHLGAMNAFCIYPFWGAEIARLVCREKNKAGVQGKA